MFIDDITKALAINDIIGVQTYIHSQFGHDRRLPEMLVAKYRYNFPKEVFDIEDNLFKFKSEKEWDFDYWIEVRSQMRDNFSEKKLDHVIEIMKYLRDKGDEKFIISKKHNTNTSNTNDIINNENKNTEKRASNKSVNKRAVIATTAGGACVGLVVAKTAINGILCGGVVGLVLGMGYLYMQNRE